MAETHKAKLIYSTKEEITLTDDEPLRSAEMFKFVSDRILEQKPKNRRKWYGWVIQSVTSPNEAYASVNEDAAEIDEQLVPMLRDINLGKTHAEGNDIIIPAGILVNPEAAWVETIKWDDQMTGRQIDINGERHYAKFTDKHRDYYRELSVRFRFRTEDSMHAVAYVMQRTQHGQGYLADLNMDVWHSSLADMGGSQTIRDVELTEEQEIGMLRIIAKMGGIALDEFDSQKEQ